VVFVQDEHQSQKFESIKAEVPDVKLVVSFSAKAGGIGDGCIDWTQIQEDGGTFKKAHPSFFERSCTQVRPDETATIVYTSGTTGQPKGVVLVHSCLQSEVEDLRDLLNLSSQDSTLTFLPFAHIFGRVELWGNVYLGWKMCFAENIDRIAANLVDIKPTVMLAVPRIFEKIYSRILSQVEEGSDLKKKIFSWSLDIGKQVSRAKREGREIPLGLLLQYRVAHKLVFSKLVQRLGGNIRFMISGGAPLSAEIAEFFHAAGILILEGYGLTETTAAVTVNTPYKFKFGSVGIAVGDVKVRIADDGEVLVKSRKVFHEYYLNPEATKEAKQQGWFCTGDIGVVDDEGFLRITDRKKDFIKTAGGKMIAPQKIENALKTNRYINQVVVFGDRMKYLTVLVTLNHEEIVKYANLHQISYKSVEQLCDHAKIRDLVNDVIHEKNAQLASYETIKNFAIIPAEFSIDNGALTPSLKVKRKFIAEKYKTVIDSLYS
jgi:long-chain acyl-CoA synthetase